MPHTHTALRAGFIAGNIGAVIVIIWFFCVDLFAGQPFFTPAALGSAVFFGLRDPAQLTISVLPVVGYTVLHFLAFYFTAIVAAYIFREAEKDQSVLWYALEFFIVLEIGFYCMVGMLFTPLLAKFAWINVAIGNVISSVAMGYYFYRTEPALRKGLTGASPSAS